MQCGKGQRSQLLEMSFSVFSDRGTFVGQTFPCARHNNSGIHYSNSRIFLSRYWIRMEDQLLVDIYLVLI